LEFGESFEECAAREVAEETGLKVRNIRYVTATNDIMKADNKHYITIFTVCERDDDRQEPEVLEPNKCEGWEWWSWEELLKHAREADAAREGQALQAQLFSPILDLVRQRPGLIPTV
jgi:8-oxo-dGTP diphosphatase